MIHNRFCIEQRNLKYKKKIIDKYLKLRSDNEEMLNLGRSGPGAAAMARPGGFAIDG